ncbi:MAG: penicillin-binding protein, partial [Rugosibacter sp.]
GFDNPQRLGNGETGGAAALPIWIGYMEKVLAGVPESWQETPARMLSVTTKDPSGQMSNEMIYDELLPSTPENNTNEPAEPAAPEKQQAPAPVVTVQPKPINTH